MHGHLNVKYFVEDSSLLESDDVSLGQHLPLFRRITVSFSFRVLTSRTAWPWQYKQYDPSKIREIIP